jgi:hypothetical protein
MKRNERRRRLLPLAFFLFPLDNRKAVRKLTTTETAGRPYVEITSTGTTRALPSDSTGYAALEGRILDTVFSPRRGRWWAAKVVGGDEMAEKI